MQKFIIENGEDLSPGQSPRLPSGQWVPCTERWCSKGTKSETQIWKARPPSKKGVNHPPLNEDVETIEKLTNDTGTGICAVHPPEKKREKKRKGMGGEREKKQLKPTSASWTQATLQPHRLPPARPSTYFPSTHILLCRRLSPGRPCGLLPNLSRSGGELRNRPPG